MTAEEDKKKCEVENAVRERREEDEVQSPRQRHDLPQPMGGKTEYGENARLTRRDRARKGKKKPEQEARTSCRQNVESPLEHQA